MKTWKWSCPKQPQADRPGMGRGTFPAGVRPRRGHVLRGECPSQGRDWAPEDVQGMVSDLFYNLGVLHTWSWSDQCHTCSSVPPPCEKGWLGMAGPLFVIQQHAENYQGSAMLDWKYLSAACSENFLWGYSPLLVPENISNYPPQSHQGCQTYSPQGTTRLKQPDGDKPSTSVQFLSSFSSPTLPTLWTSPFWISWLQHELFSSSLYS